MERSEGVVGHVTQRTIATAARGARARKVRESFFGGMEAEGDSVRMSLSAILINTITSSTCEEY